MVYEYKELEEATSQFHLKTKIGKGGFGVMYQAMLRHVPVAIKVLSDVRQS